MVCNFPKKECLEFEDVKTLFHEFGHIMHFLLCQSSMIAHNSFDVECDFVEAPSQMLEYWCVDKTCLSMISEHIDTKQPLPDTIIDNLIKSNKLMDAHAEKRQIILALFDTMCHDGLNIWSLLSSNETKTRRESVVLE